MLGKNQINFMNGYAFFAMSALNTLDLSRNLCIDLKLINGNGVAGMLPFVTDKCGYCRNISEKKICSSLHQAEEFDSLRARKSEKYLKDMFGKMSQQMQNCGSDLSDTKYEMVGYNETVVKSLTTESEKTRY